MSSHPASVSISFADDDDESEEAPMPVAKAGAYKPTRRLALVSHPPSKYDENKQIIKVAKSPRAQAKIQEITNTNFLFSRLDSSQKQTIIGISLNKLFVILIVTYLFICSF